ncbi:MAG TPA: nitrilase-related carbon-nitrogen hydrolase [Candidatus Sulfotelmatobacter sp.]
MASVTSANRSVQGKLGGSMLHGKQRWWWLAGAIVLLLVADGRYTIALAAWLAPLCLLSFVRAENPKRGLLIAYCVLVVTRGITLRGMSPSPGIFYYIFLIISCVSAVIPYVADRLMAKRIGKAAGVFVFPTTLVATQFVYSHGPHGSWGSLAYTQAGNLPLLQLLSITGLWGIVFLMGWFAASGARMLQEGIGSLSARRGFLLFAGTYVVVVLLGGVRMVLLTPTSPTIRVASLSPVKTGQGISDAMLHDIAGGKASDAEVLAFRTTTMGIRDDLMTRSEREARAGAKIIFWSEGAATVLKQDEPELLARASALAAKYQMYFGVSLATWSSGRPHPMENKLVLFEPSGDSVWQYSKVRLTPGPEAAMVVPSVDGRLKQSESPYGKLSVAICYDMDFLQLMRQAGEMRDDILLSPASDWRAIDPRHTEIASFRAIEEGFNLVRQANMGRSAAYDYQGRLLATMDEFQSTDLTMVAQVPTRGVRTIYSQLGDWLAWISIVAFAIFVFVVLRNPHFS